MRLVTGRAALLAVAVVSVSASLLVPASVHEAPVVSAAVVAPKAERVTQPVIERSGIVYAARRDRTGARQRLRLDLWLPTRPRAHRPAVVLAHGGGFVRGTRKKRQIRRIAAKLARHGYVTASVTYRLTPNRATRQAGGIDLVRSRAARRAQYDLQAAVRFLRHRSRRYAVDRSRIAVLGSSAGGIAALRVAFNPEDPGHSGNRRYRSHVAAAISLWAIGDPDMIERGAPPVLMLHGRKDRVLPFQLARITCVEQRRRDNVCQHLWWRREGHAVWHRTRQVERASLRFLERHLG